MRGRGLAIAGLVLSILSSILITIIIIISIWATSIPMVKNSLDIGTACFDAQSDISLITDSNTCINKTSGNIFLQIKKGPNSNVPLIGIQTIIFSDKKSQTLRINKTNNDNHIVGILPENNGMQIITLIGPYANINRVAIAPITVVGTTEELCDSTTSEALPDCK